ncbi:hypothetical protein PHYPSEUDO_010285 [Phytophthora pseudosyringae]|uniref:Uncharacterized protein n=1 Tax=Phytophthora pseudosyringae TaxID=221518 RepID=A0A8T1VAH1_9STRA|nr:hypothetical protein PHYPSEUDO_010285 [Phytophthora pseudosyringae]
MEWVTKQLADVALLVDPRRSDRLRSEKRIRDRSASPSPPPPPAKKALSTPLTPPLLPTPHLTLLPNPVLTTSLLGRVKMRLSGTARSKTTAAAMKRMKRTLTSSTTRSTTMARKPTEQF